MMHAAWGAFLLVLGAPQICTAQLCGQSYDNRIAHIHTAAQQLDGTRPRLVLTGSSSIRKWPQTDTVFSQYDVVNAGFGGSCFSDLWALRDTLIYALRPDVLVVYEGDNDLSDGVPAADILEVADQLLDELSRRLPSTEVIVIAPKASRARHHLTSAYLALNRKLRLMAHEPRCPLGGLLGRATSRRRHAARRLVCRRPPSFERFGIRRVGV